MIHNKHYLEKKAIYGVHCNTALWGPTDFGVKIDKLTPKCVKMQHINALWVTEF
jgi:hypothetical protein